MNIRELKELIEDLEDGVEVLKGIYVPSSGKTHYSEPDLLEEYISRNSNDEPIECREGDGGNEIVLVIT